MFTEFGQNTAGVLRMEEGDIQTFCTLAGSLVDKTSLRVFAELGEDAAGGLRVEEGDVQAFGTLAGLLVDEAHALLADLGECVGNAVLDAEGDVVYTLVALVEPLLNGAFGRCGLEELELHLTALQEGGLHLLVLDDFRCITLQAQHVLEERQTLFNTLDGNAQMLNV